MERMHEKLSDISKVTDIICLRIRRKLEEVKYNSRLCIIKPAVGEKFQVAIGIDKFVVDLKTLTCSCRTWQLTGIPCIHACVSIHFMKRDSANYVHAYYSVEKYISTYAIGLEPINGPNMWPKASAKSN